MLPKSRKEALHEGSMHYFTGRECKHGHVAKRRSENGLCQECSKIKSKLYMKKRRNNKCPALVESKRKDREKNKEKYAAYMAEYYQKNKKKIGEYMAERYKEKRDEIIKKARDWAIENPEGRRAQHRNRKHKIRNSGTHTAQEVESMLEKQKFKCVYCKRCIKKDRHIDHIIPISEGGSNEIHNLQGLCPNCNMRKSNKMPEVWANELGMLI